MHECTCVCCHELHALFYDADARTLPSFSIHASTHGAEVPLTSSARLSLALRARVVRAAIVNCLHA